MLMEYLSIPELAPRLAITLFLCKLFSVPFCEDPIAHA